MTTAALSVTVMGVVLIAALDVCLLRQADLERIQRSPGLRKAIIDLRVTHYPTLEVPYIGLEGGGDQSI